MQRFCALCRRYALWILITLALLLCQRWWMARGKPERLLELPKGYEFVRLRDKVILLKKQDTSIPQEGVKYIHKPGSNRLVPMLTLSSRSSYNPAEPVFSTMSVNGGPLRSFPSSSIETAPSASIFTAGADTYEVAYHKTASTLVGIPPGYGSHYGGGGSIGSSAPPPPPKPPFHTVTHREEAVEITAILRSMAHPDARSSVPLLLSLGYFSRGLIPPGEAQPFTFKSKIAFYGSGVYWVKSFPDVTTYRESTNRQVVGNLVFKYRSAVMTMPLHGGTLRKLLDNVASDTTLLASEDGVLCRFKKGSRWEWILVSPDGTSHQVRTDASPDDPPVECNHCLYWSKSDSSGSPTSVLRLMQTNTDGSIPHVLYTVSNANSVEIKAWRGQVYFRIVDNPIRGETVSVYKSTLYRVNPATSSGVERLCTLPDNTREMLFDGDCLYCLAREEKAGLMDTFRSNSSADTRHVLYRYRLPNP